MAARKPADILGAAIKDFEEDKRPHDQFASNVDAWYRAYRGLIEIRSKAAEWTSKLHPAYGLQVVETLTANVVDPQPRWTVKPYPRMTDTTEREVLLAGAKANELLLQQQVMNPLDPFAAKQVVFAKQAFITGLSVFKPYWRYDIRNQQRQGIVIREQDGVPVPVVGATTERTVLYDDWAVDVVDVRDWFVHQAATSLENAKRVTHRSWVTFDELKRLEKQGVYGAEAGGQAVDDLKESRDFNAEASGREQELFQTDRTKDKIELLEQWRREPDGSIRVVSIANRAVLLRDQPSPFWHGRYPFVVCAPIPDLGRITGISVMELVSDLQEAAWSFLNQRIDATELLANPIWGVRTDLLDDPDAAANRYPGMTVEIEGGSVNDAIKQLDINPLPAQISLEVENQLKQDLQNIPGAAPSLLGQTNDAGGPTTATEASLTTSLAQRRIALMKQQFKWAYKQVGEQALALNQQFVKERRLVPRLGAEGAQAFAEIHPLLLQGDFYIDIENMDESLMKEQRLAQAQARLQVAGNVVGIFAELSKAPGSGTQALNMRKFMDDYLEAAGVQDTEAYYSQAQPTLSAGQPSAPQGAPSPEPSGGVTAPQAYDATSPSNAVSLSPLADQQRMGAMAGGPVNA